MMGVKSGPRKRVVIIALGTFGLFSLLIIQFFRIQIIEGEKWTRVAQGQHFFVITEPFLRGTFYSNTSLKQGHPQTPQPLTMDIQKYHLFVDPQSIPEEKKEEIINSLITLMTIPSTDINEFREQFEHKSRSRKLATWQDEEVRNAVQNWWFPFARKAKIAPNAIYFESDYQRSYPFGKMLGQVLHTIQSNKDGVTKQGVPTGGLELQFNSYLKGKEGKRRLMRSPRNAFEMGEVIEPPQNGADIYLSINHYLQAIAEEEVEKGVKTCKAKSGWAVMMNPYTGEILALAQYPFFYPSDYQNYFNDPNRIEDTKVKAVTDANEPGSTMKAITLAVTMKASQDNELRGGKAFFSPQEKIPTDNAHFPGRKDLKDTHFYGNLNMYMGFQKSSNIYMARLIERVINNMGNTWYRSQLVDVFGFGLKTGIELPAESPGVVPTPGKMHPNGALEWSLPTPFSLAIGHNIQINSVQMLRAFAVFANGGYLVKPTLVRKIVKKQSDGLEEILVDNTTPERVQQFPRVLDPNIVNEVVKAMKFTTKIGGTASRADIKGYTECGKTGSARKIVDGQYSTQKHFSTFMGFAPVPQPAFVLLVAMDEPAVYFIPGEGPNSHGGICCAPVFREIAKRSLEYLGIAPDDPYGYPVGDPRYNSEKADFMKEVKELAEQYKEWNHK